LIARDLADDVRFRNNADHRSIRIAYDQEGLVRLTEELGCIGERGIGLNCNQTLKR
jgi:hypothetical protein